VVQPRWRAPIKGLSIRIAKGMNRMMGRKGRVFGDRYHSRCLRTPTELQNAVRYIRDNHRNHLSSTGEHLPSGWVDPFSSDHPDWTWLLPTPGIWLAQTTMQRAP
jgi:hypothetical protein